MYVFLRHILCFSSDGTSFIIGLWSLLYSSVCYWQLNSLLHTSVIKVQNFFEVTNILTEIMLADINIAQSLLDVKDLCEAYTWMRILSHNYLPRQPCIITGYLVNRLVDYHLFFSL